MADYSDKITRSYSAIILAGGKSSRMGTDKASLVFEGETLKERQCRKLAEAGISDILVSGYGEGMIPDDEPGSGPLGGLATCLLKAENEQCIVVPVDVPMLTQDVFDALLQAHEKGDKPVTIAMHGGKDEFLIGIYDRCVCEVIREQLAEDRRAVRAVLERTGYNVAVCEDEKAFINCNTRETFDTL